MKPDYRPDIDGLRAIAVLSVFIFHLNAKWLPGGFTGVDIFFVISGYLISGHIFSAVAAGTFSYKEFYRRRINRILPAFYGVIIFTSILGILFFLPSDLYAIAQSAMNALKFKANLYFARDQDYFRPKTAELPLLNLWSLSVEEQFYLILPPFVLFALSRLSPRLKIFSIYALILASVGLAEYLLRTGATQIAYYSVWTRSSELLLGTLLALRTPVFKKTLIYEVAGWLGLGMLAASFIVISGHIPFPGLVSLLPCVGATLVILAGTGERASGTSRLLALRPLVFVGLISYSLYLYHWPIMALVRYLQIDTEFDFTSTLLISLAAFSLAILSWRFVETPFRRTQQSFARVFAFRFVVPSLAAILVLNWIASTQGLPERLAGRAPLLERTLSFVDSSRYCYGGHFNEANLERCKFGDGKAQAKTLLIGDSTGGHYEAVLDAIGQRQGFSFVSRTLGGCAPVVKIPGEPVPWKVDADCLAQVDWSEKGSEAFDTIVISGFWSGHLNDMTKPSFRDYLTRSLKSLTARHKNIVLIEQIPECHGILKFYRASFSPLRSFFDENQVMHTIAANCGSEARKANQFMQELAAATGATYLPIADMYLEKHSLPFFNGEYLYKDDDHLNGFGAEIMGKSIAESFPDFKTYLKQ